MDSDMTQTCDCGNDTYRIKWSAEGDGTVIWPECADCGRPTGVLNDDGLRKKNQWLLEQNDEQPADDLYFEEVGEIPEEYRERHRMRKGDE